MHKGPVGEFQAITLRGRIDSFQLDAPGSTLTFSRRLARENGWDHGRALRVIVEYRRFLYLTQVAGHVVVPSEAVDQAWHLHLTYTRSYWEELCGQVLGGPLHHDPTTGGAAEGQKFKTLYEQTLARYREHFGESAPGDLWPGAAERFAEATRYRRVNTAGNWIVPKPRLGLSAVPVGAVGLVFGLELVAAAFPFSLRGPDFLAFAGGGGVALLVIAAALRMMFKTPWKSADSSKALSDPYAVAYLAGGEERCLAAALTSLVHRRAIRVSGDQQEVSCAGPVPRDAHPFEQAVYGAAQAGGKIPVASLKGLLVRPIDILRAHLEKHGLLVTGMAAVRVRTIPLVVGLVMPVIGVARIVQGIRNDKPVAFLVIITIGLTLAALFGVGRKAGASLAGGSALRQTRREQTKIKALKYDEFQPEYASVLPMAVGLFGLSAMMPCFGAGMLTDMEHLKRSAMLGATNSGGGWDSGCGGDGGSGGGSGCGGGGCGGCGGD